MTTRYSFLLALAFNVFAVLPPTLHAGRPHPRAASERTPPKPRTGIERYGDQKSISSKDVTRLPSHLTLDQLYQRWGFVPLGDPPLSIMYHGDGNLWFYVNFDLNVIPTIFAGDYHKVEVLRITLMGRGHYEQFPYTTVWISERESPPTRVSAEDIRDLPDELYLDQIQSRWGKSRVTGMVSESTRTLLKSPRVDLFPPIASVSYRTPIDGYSWEFFLDWAAAKQFVAGKNTRVKVVSIYLIGPNGKALCQWGSYINLTTGALYKPALKADPFMPDAEPRPKGFLGMD